MKKETLLFTVLAFSCDVFCNFVKILDWKRIGAHVGEKIDVALQAIQASISLCT
jgi:hypothetical protein